MRSFPIKTGGRVTVVFSKGSCSLGRPAPGALVSFAIIIIVGLLDILHVESMTSDYLGIKGLNVSDDSGNAATYAIDAIADAVSKVSSQRSALGAIQNRLEHTIANLDNISENTTAAESRIRDTDMAGEMVDFSIGNILTQAGTSMMSQANQLNASVLSLLQ